jgi:putative protein-disulfide isomerase
VSVQVRWFTDPACSWSWGAEPLLRRLLWEFDGELDFVWAMGGLARRYGSSYRDEEGAIGSGSGCFADLMSHWLNVAGHTGMPCDPRLWTANPIDSTFPACIAVEAASEQGWEAGYRYMRRVREGLFCERRQLDNREALVAEAEAADLDRPRFEAALDSLPPLEAIERFGRMATREVEVLTEAPGAATCAELWCLAAEGRLRPVRALTGTIWEAA